MTLVDGFAPLLPLQAMLVVRKITENSLYHNQHCSVGGRGSTIILSYGWSHNFCEGLWMNNQVSRFGIDLECASIFFRFCIFLPHYNTKKNA